MNTPNVTAAVGRPRKSPSERKRNNLSIRVQDGLRDDLLASAARNERSLSDEVVARLIKSFTKDDDLGGPEMRAVVMRMVEHFTFAGQHDAELKFGLGVTPQTWLSDPSCYEAAMLSTIGTLWARRPDRTRETDMRILERLEQRVSL